MKPGRAYLSMVTSFATGVLLGALFVTKKRRKILKKKEQTNEAKTI